jgi:signal transduction histidine kinase
MISEEPGPSSGNPILPVNPSSSWIHRWIYYLASGFMFAAAALRSFLLFRESPLLDRILLLLAAWLLAFLGSLLLARRSPRLSALLIGLEFVLVLGLLLVTRADYFVFLFAIPCMQTMQQFSSRATAMLIGLSTLLTFLTLLKSRGPFFALAMAVVFFGGSAFLIVYIGNTRRARLIQDQQQALVGELQQANRQLEFYSRRLQQLAAGRERQRLARELHDSVTQTIFSMTLTTQSALLLLERDPAGVAAQLERLSQLTGSALAEMQALISRLAPERAAAGSLAAALRKHLDERRRLENLSVSLELEGSQPLTAAEEQSLFRIAREALNNVVKHAGVAQASLRLNLAGQPWLEIEDRGAGFDPLQVGSGGQVGLVSMRERAAEIGWCLRVESVPGHGTRIRVVKGPGGAKQA